MASVHTHFKTEKLSLKSLATGEKHEVRWIPDKKLVSVYDVIRVVRGTDVTQCTIIFLRLSEETKKLCQRHRFQGDSRETPVADMYTIYEMIFELPGKTAQKIRRNFAKQLRRLMAGDETLIPEIQAQAAQVAPEVKNALLSGLPSQPVVQNTCHNLDVELISAKRQKLECSKLDIECSKLDLEIAEYEAKTKEAKARANEAEAKAKKIECKSALDSATAQMDAYKQFQGFCGIDIATDPLAKIEMKDLSTRLFEEYSYSLRAINTRNNYVPQLLQEQPINRAIGIGPDVSSNSSQSTVVIPPPAILYPINQPMICKENNIKYNPLKAQAVGRRMSILFKEQYGIARTDMETFNRMAPLRDVMYNGVTRKERTYMPKDAELMLRAIKIEYEMPLNA